MATFAPDLPLNQQEDYIRLAGQPITQPESDKSKALNIAAAGQGIEGGAQIAENTFESGMKEKIRAGSEAIRDTTTLAYENIRNAQMTGQQPSDAAMKTAGFTGSLLKGVGAAVPSGLQAGLDQATDIGTALAQGGMSKANDTLYTGQLNAMAKKLRAQYPGHADFIDEQISKITGINPANAYMQNLLQDINRNAVVANSQHNKLMNEGYKLMDKVPNIYPYIKAYELGLPNSENNLARAISNYASGEATHTQWQRDREQKLAGREDVSFDAKQQYQTELAAAAYRQFNAVIDIPGLSSPQTIQKLLDDQRDGRISLTSDQHNQLLSAAVKARDAFLNEGKQIANDRGYSRAIHDANTEKSILDGEGQKFQRLVDAINNKEYGTLFEAQRHVKAIQDQTKQDLYDDPTMGKYWATVGAVTEIGGPNWANRLDTIGYQAKYLNNLQSYVSNSRKEMSTPNNGRDMRDPDNVKSMYEYIAQLQKFQKQGGQVDPRAYKDIVHFVDFIADDKTPAAVKLEIARNAFNEKNFSTLDAFKMDFTDSNKKFHEGKYSVFDTLTQPGVTDNIKKLGDQGVWNQYKNWAETSFAKLYREDLNNVGQLGVNPGVPLRVLWDSTHNRFDLDDGKGGPVKPTEVEAFTNSAQRNYIAYAQTVINRLNGGLSNLAQVQSKDSKDPTATSAYLMQKMTEFGFSPDEKIGGLPGDMYEAIRNSKAKKDLSTAFEKAKKSE